MNLLARFADNEVGEMRLVVKKFRSVALDYRAIISLFWIGSIGFSQDP